MTTQKSFHFKATDESGKVAEGKIQAATFAEATSQIKGRGLELVSLEEVKEMNKMRNFIFQALDAQGEKVEGTIQGEDQDSIAHKLEEEMGYQVTKLELKSHQPTSGPQVIRLSSNTRQQGEVSPKSSESIIFKREQRVVRKKPVLSEKDLQSVHDDVRDFLHSKGDRISDSVKKRLLHFDDMIELVRDSQDKRRWKKLKAQIKSAMKMAKREVKEYEDRIWDEAERSGQGEGFESYTDFVEEKQEQKKRVKRDWMTKLENTLQAIDEPNVSSEKEVMLKQHYESVWFELQRFMGALFVFYIACFFLSYYFKRSGMSDQFLVRIYDTTLFKQIVLVLFTFFGLLSIRLSFLPKRLKSDAVLAAIWLITIWAVFW